MADKVTMTLEYEAVARKLSSAALEAGASEVHGLLCGVLCSGIEDASALWRAELFGDAGPGDPTDMECRRSLDELFQATRTQLEDAHSGFSLLLPDDERPLRQRALALAEWCQGFLYGLGICGISGRTFTGETREALQDLTEIVRMDQHELQESEENEEAYMEVSEFVRIAALLVRENMRAGPEQAS